MRKYNIVGVDYDYQTSIIETFVSHKDAIEYLSELINKEYKSEDKQKSYRVYYESNSEITVHYVGYFSKSLHCKYFIIDFNDKTNEIKI